MAILAEGKVQVIRDGKIQSVMPEELVLDDVILLERGGPSAS